MNKAIIKYWMRAHAWVLKASKGRVFNSAKNQKFLLLTTTGRKTGKEHTIPIAYFEHGQDYIIVASNWAREQQAHWYLNLKHDPAAKLGILGEVFDVVATEAEGEDYESLWEFVTERHPPYISYQEKTSRRIPVMVFSRS